MNWLRTSLLIGLLTLAAAAGGGWLGVSLGLRQVQAHAGLDETLHREMHFTPAQDRRLDGLERAFADQRAGLQTQMRQADADLARAIADDHSYSPAAAHAVAKLHAAMGALQEATIRHALAMRAAMTAEQQSRFDALIDRALRPPAP